MLELFARVLHSAPTLLELAGAGLIGYGVWLWWPPAALIWGGVACFGLSFTIETRRKKEK